MEDALLCQVETARDRHPSVQEGIKGPQDFIGGAVQSHSLGLSAERLLQQISDRKEIYHYCRSNFSGQRRGTIRNS